MRSVPAQRGKRSLCWTIKASSFKLEPPPASSACAPTPTPITPISFPASAHKKTSVSWVRELVLHLEEPYAGHCNAVTASSQPPTPPLIWRIDKLEKRNCRALANPILPTASPPLPSSLLPTVTAADVALIATAFKSRAEAECIVCRKSHGANPSPGNPRTTSALFGRRGGGVENSSLAGCCEDVSDAMYNGLKQLEQCYNTYNNVNDGGVDVRRPRRLTDGDIAATRGVLGQRSTSTGTQSTSKSTTDGGVGAAASDSDLLSVTSGSVPGKGYENVCTLRKYRTARTRGGGGGVEDVDKAGEGVDEAGEGVDEAGEGVDEAVGGVDEAVGVGARRRYVGYDIDPEAVMEASVSAANFYMRDL
ncbi:hypothetical protein C8R45DRAFT_919240 [Mycena sanguinolenta]|nr:hypothetical protein C8R45DRAFT_919240 [Mycena sanguinolenta]